MEEEEQSKNLLEEARENIAKLEKANAEFKEYLARAERLAAINLLSGRSEAGMQPPPPKEETPKEYKDRVMRGEV